MTGASGPDDPRFPGIPPGVPPEVPFPPEPERPERPQPPYPPVPVVPVPPAHQPPGDLRSQVYDQLLARRTVLLDRALDAEMAMLVCAQLMTLDGESADPIELIVNSPGGPLDAATAVLDTIDLARAPVGTVCLGQATGTAAVVVAAGTGRRRAGATARLQLRLPEAELTGTATRLAADAADLRRLYDAVVDRLAAATGQARRLVARDVERGRTLAGQDAVAYGLVDEVVSSPGTRAPTDP
jgi:ATP-dependent Clp protease protease subunit